MDALKRLLEQLRSTWAEMSMPRRLTLLLLVGFSLAVIGGVGYWIARPDYRVLFSDLSPEDAGAITTKLDSLGISYRLASGGTTVLVPAERVQRLRLDLAVEGLPVKGGKGFELFDGGSFGATPFTQHVNYLRALQGELAKTIGQIESVAYARVHIVRPEPSPFIREQKPTTASVVLRLKPGATLHRSVASGIAALVARSVEGLSPDQVTILDTSGRVLSEPQSGEVGMASSQLDYRRSLERHLASKAEEMLERVLGPGRAIVRITADVNFQRMKETRETYSPEGRVITSEKITSVKTTTSGPGARGAAGAASNLPNGRTATPASPTSSSNQEETTETGWAVSRTHQELEDKMGGVERLTIAALVDLSAAGSPDGSTRPTLAVADAIELIKQAVGFKGERDAIKVSDVRLTGPGEEIEADETWERWLYWRSLAEVVRNASLGLGAVVALVLGWLSIRSLRRPALSPAAPVPLPHREQVLERLATVARRDPEVIARVLTGWLGQKNGHTESVG